MLRSREAESRLKISYTVMNNGIIVKTRGLRILGGGLFLLGSLLLAVSILFLTILICGIFVGGSCNVGLHLPTVILALASMLLGAIVIGWSFRKNGPR